jgi:diguanylate cyclase (GGDEF)-like protein/PAS domain S-box-containing protein
VTLSSLAVALVMVALGAYAVYELRNRRGLEGQAAAEHSRAALLQSRFHAAVYRAPVGVVVFDLTGRVEVVNDPIYELLGLVRGESSPQVMDYFLPEDVPTIAGYLQRLANRETERVDGDFQLVRPDGSRRWCRISCTSILGPVGETVAVVGHVQDIETERAAIEELRSRSHWFSSIVERSSDLILLFDAAGMVTWASPSIVPIVGVSPEDVLGQPVRRFIHPDDRARMQEALEEAIETGTSRVEFRLAAVGGGEERWLETTASNLLDDPDVAAVITLSRDVTERHQSTARLAHQAAHDPLTGLLNRRAITAQLGAALAATDHEPVTVAYLDLDGFKPVNDLHGHRTGDELLRVVARALEGEVRGHDLLARLGGDEFVVVLRDALLADALEVAERIRIRLAEPIRLQHVAEPLRISASIGVAVALPGDSDTSLLHAADLALYEAKRRGRNRVEVSTRALSAAGAEVDELLDDIARDDA